VLLSFYISSYFFLVVRVVHFYYLLFVIQRFPCFLVNTQIVWFTKANKTLVMGSLT